MGGNFTPYPDVIRGGHQESGMICRIADAGAHLVFRLRSGGETTKKKYGSYSQGCLFWHGLSLFSCGMCKTYYTSMGTEVQGHADNWTCEWYRQRLFLLRQEFHNGGPQDCAWGFPPNIMFL